jgi:hypothetical protein
MDWPIDQDFTRRSQTRTYTMDLLSRKEAWIVDTPDHDGISPRPSQFGVVGARITMCDLAGEEFDPNAGFLV